jgi:murein DD-endopeptidase MepM/ murein hydrolase activator NlpD
MLLVAIGLAGPAVADAGTPASRWVWPLAGPHTVSRPFDPPATPYGPGHRGADLPGRIGEPVRAAGAGRISYAGLLAGRGVVGVVHGDLRTTYEPVTAAVRVGQQVDAGQLIGRLDTGHRGCLRACLHWGLLRRDVYLDPVRLVRSGPSRLLPLDAPASAMGGARPVAGAGPPAAATLRPGALPSAPAAPRPAGQPAFALRAGDAASAGGALAALVAGLVLLRRPPRPPDRPLTPAMPTSPEPATGTAERIEPRTVGLVDLAAERHRRRHDVA